MFRVGDWRALKLFLSLTFANWRTRIHSQTREPKTNAKKKCVCVYKIFWCVYRKWYAEKGEHFQVASYSTRTSSLSSSSEWQRDKKWPVAKSEDRSSSSRLWCVVKSYRQNGKHRPSNSLCLSLSHPNYRSTREPKSVRTDQNLSNYSNNNNKNWNGKKQATTKPNFTTRTSNDWVNCKEFAIHALNLVAVCFLLRVAALLFFFF